MSTKRRDRHVSIDEDDHWDDEDDDYYDEQDAEFMYQRRRTSSAVSDKGGRQSWLDAALARSAAANTKGNSSNSNSTGNNNNSNSKNSGTPNPAAASSHKVTPGKGNMVFEAPPPEPEYEEFDPGEVDNELLATVTEMAANIIGPDVFSSEDLLDSVLATEGRSANAALDWLLELQAYRQEQAQGGAGRPGPGGKPQPQPKPAAEVPAPTRKGLVIDLSVASPGLGAASASTPGTPASFAVSSDPPGSDKLSALGASSGSLGFGAPLAGDKPGKASALGGSAVASPSLQAQPRRSSEEAELGASTQSPALGVARTPLAARVMPRQCEKRVKGAVAEMEAALRNPRKDHLNLVVLGHVDAGKSTLVGHLLLQLGVVSDRVMHKMERESREMGKESFKFAWVMDEGAEERERGITMDVGMTHFSTVHREFTLLDAPGHRDFVPNMISGAAQADVALLVVDSARGEFEAGFVNGGQTKEHVVLAKALGVTQIAVAVNKLELHDWSKARFDEIVAALTPFLRQAGYAKPRFVPVSGFSGENLAKRTAPKLLDWYTGPTVVELLDSFEPLARDVDRPLRLCVTDVLRAGAGGVSVAGKIESGRVFVGDKVAVMPLGEVAQVKSIELRSDAVKWGEAGSNIVVGLVGLEKNIVRVGSVLCDPQALVPVASRFRARIITTHDVKVPLIHGTQVLFFSQGGQEPAVVQRLEALLDRATGEVKTANPRAVGASATADVIIKLESPAAMESFASQKALGRFTLRKGATTLAAGIVLEILE